MTVTDELLAANARFAETFSDGHLPRRPARGVAILTCLDARINPVRALGLAIGDANVIRNAGGRAADALRSLAVAVGILGVREIVVIHHTDCGLCNVSNADVRARIADVVGPEAARTSAEIDFLPFSNLDESVREDVALIRAFALIPDDISVRGFVYYVETGRLQEVVK